jgi:hypothetical protein
VRNRAPPVSPRSFAVWRYIAIFYPSLVLFALLIALLYWFTGFELASTIYVIVMFFILGGWTLGYVAWALSNDWNGLVRVPARKWRVSIESDTVSLNTGRIATRVPMSMITKVQLVSDGSWETLKGVEDKCLVLRLSSGLSISVPGSSDGFEDLQSTMREHHAIEIKEIG